MMIKPNLGLHVAPIRAAKLLDDVVLHVGETLVSPVTYVRNLGVYIDRHLDMKTHVSEVISTCYCHIRHIQQIKKFLPKSTKECVIIALITSHIHYCNSLLVQQHPMSLTGSSQRLC